MRLFAAPAIATVCLLASIGLAARGARVEGPAAFDDELPGADQPAAGRPVLSGAWTIDRTLGTPPGSVAMPDDGMDGPDPGGGCGPGGFGGGIGGGRRGGMGGGGMGGPGGGGRRREGDMATRRALMEELMLVPQTFTIAQDGDKVLFIEPDGVVRAYVANDKTEKHQLQNGTIETKSRWDGGALLIELKPAGGLTITRRYAVHGTPRQLEVTTTTNRGPKNVKRVAVYDVVDGPAAAAQ